MEYIELKEFNGHKLATVFNDSGNKKVVIICHGFRSSSAGGKRKFVRMARKLSESGISSLRFDQYGSGNSEGDFFNSSFNDWVKTTDEIVKSYLSEGFNVSLFGVSMGGSAVIAAASEIPELISVVTWVPDANIGNFEPPQSGVMEELGEIVQASYWQEAHDANIADKFSLIKSPTYIVQCTNDEYVNKENRDALTDRAKPHQKVDIYEGYSHSSWTYKQSEDIIEKSVDFIVQSFN
jgi:esterase/lipase